ncbi:hypothetical protein HK098_006977 [Nowakowskiella sp. JEL0407]|nr:hypothetical protein HK098_006977 [Nowakowskiella sp. JEL0407]
MQDAVVPDAHSVSILSHSESLCFCEDLDDFAISSLKFDFSGDKIEVKSPRKIHDVLCLELLPLICTYLLSTDICRLRLVCRYFSYCSPLMTSYYVHGYEIALSNFHFRMAFSFASRTKRFELMEQIVKREVDVVYRKRLSLLSLLQLRTHSTSNSFESLIPEDSKITKSQIIASLSITHPVSSDSNSFRLRILQAKKKAFINSAAHCFSLRNIPTPDFEFLSILLLHGAEGQFFTEALRKVALFPRQLQVSAHADCKIDESTLLNAAEWFLKNGAVPTGLHILEDLRERGDFDMVVLFQRYGAGYYLIMENC